MQQEQLTVTKTEAAQIFEDRNQVRLLEPFIQEPCTLSDAASKLGIKAPRLHYHVNRFLEHGLVEIVGTTKRNGRNIKLYQTTARAFFLPFELTSSESLEKFLADIHATFYTNLNHAIVRHMESLAPDWGFRWMLNERGQLYFETLPQAMTRKENNELVFAEDTPAQLSFNVGYSLEHQTAKAFQKELVDLTERIFTSQTTGEKRYMFSLALAPIPKD